jgi:hypothetical protein
MSFIESSQNVWLEDGHILHAQCQDGNGNFNECIIDLNKHVGNTDGWFMWDGESKHPMSPRHTRGVNDAPDFSDTAVNVTLNGTVLEADMAMLDGNTRERQGLQLNERFSNQNGQLVVRLDSRICRNRPAD